MSPWCVPRYPMFSGVLGPRRLTAAVVPAGLGGHLSGSNGLFDMEGGCTFQEKAPTAVYSNKGVRMCLLTRNERCLRCPSAPPQGETSEQPSSNTRVSASASWGADAFSPLFFGELVGFFIFIFILAVKKIAAQNMLVEKNLKRAVSRRVLLNNFTPVRRVQPRGL